MNIYGSLMVIFDEHTQTNIYDDEKARNTRYIKKAVRITSNSLDK